MKSRVKKYISIFLICSFSITLCLYIPGLVYNNKCYEYVENYIYQLPIDTETLKAIDEITADFLSGDTYEKNFFLSSFHKKYITDSQLIIPGPGMEIDKSTIKQRGFNEVVVLRLRCLAILGREQEYKALFYEYCDNFAVGFVMIYSDYWNKDSNYPLEPGSETFSLIIDGYHDVIDACTTDMDKYYMIEELHNFLLPYDFYEDEIEWCNEERKTITDKHKKDGFLDEISEWNGFINEPIINNAN